MLAVFHNQIDRDVFDEELRFVLARLLIERMQHRVAGSVGSGAGTLRDALAILRSHATEGTLVDPSIRRTRERDTIVLEFDDSRRGLLAHELDRILVAEPVGTLDGVVEVIAPVILAHVAESCGNTALRRNRVTTRREYFGDAGRRQTRLGKT